MNAARPPPRTPLLDRSLLEAPVIQRGEYAYFVHPLTDGIPALDPAVLEEVGVALEAIAGAAPTRILTAEAMGIPAAVALSQRTGAPVTIARKRAYGLPGETPVPAKTGYGSSTLYINSIGPGDRVTIVDDVVSTGGTLLAMVEGVRATGATLLEILVVLSRGTGLTQVQERAGVPVKVLRRIEVDPVARRVRLLPPQETVRVRP